MRSGEQEVKCVEGKTRAEGAEKRKSKVRVMRVLGEGEQEDEL